MSRSKTLLLVVAAFVVVVAARQSLRPPPDPAAAAPAVAGTAAEQALASAKAAGRPVVLSFRSSTCIPCRAMSDILAQLRPRYADRVAFVDVALEPDTPDQALIERYAIRVKPTTFVLTVNGDVAEEKLGVWEPAELSARLDAVLGH